MCRNVLQCSPRPSTWIWGKGVENGGDQEREGTERERSNPPSKNYGYGLVDTYISK